tara:strand:- start:1484 stop:1978 length:495 start_codon:yes stop_codon:yes gene_type:complete
VVIIIDDVISNLDSIKNNILTSLKEKEVSINWYSFEYEHDFKDLCVKFVDIASNYFDLSSCVGYEFWTHKNTRPPEGWHYDKDELLFEKDGIYDYPLCSMVYYPFIENLEGGKLHLECDVVTPKENRLIIFSPKTYHYVEPFKGERVSLLINPWKKILSHSGTK